jgi:hypothetical protein
MWVGFELGPRSQKEKSRFDYFWTSQWTFENSTFLPLVHRDSWPADNAKSIFLSIFHGLNPTELFSFRIFGKKISNQILVEQGKV